ncbi:unnamed protein product [Peronospora belbahrii]|uniref:Uncharacterized protein n=1 Tax=Peronospora belbahrii TaxID=622444 RepID=A0ABN8D4U3_9STRA|nr:unnamed protein product [Peronospora belbahrii]
MLLIVLVLSTCPLPLRRHSCSRISKGRLILAQYPLVLGFMSQWQQYVLLYTTQSTYSGLVPALYAVACGKNDKAVLKYPEKDVPALKHAAYFVS